MNLKPVQGRVLLFSPVRSRVIGKTGVLFKAETHLKIGEYTETRLCWVADWANDCKTLVQENLSRKGAVVAIPDSFCYIHNDLDLWDDYKKDPAFAGLVKYAEKYKCDIETKMVHENSIAAEVEDTWK